jgi:hypothetical protein
MAQNLRVKKTYIQQTAIQKKGGDLGIREIEIKFGKNDFDQFSSVGIYGVPIFHLTYKFLNSTKIFKRDIGGYSAQILEDELRCSKSKMLNRHCLNFPDNVCSSCNNLVCVEHKRKCEKCGAILRDNCGVSKGMVSKHYFCSKCG